jgi:hypothetical protein
VVKMISRHKLGGTEMSRSSTNDHNLDKEIKQIFEEISGLRSCRVILRNPKDLEKLERDLGELTDRLHGLLVGEQIQRSIDSEAVEDEVAELVASWPKRLRDDGIQRVLIRTGRGVCVPVLVTYYCRRGVAAINRRSRGLFAALVILGIHNRCTPSLISLVSALAAILGSLSEASNVLAQIGISMTTKVVRRIAYCVAERARKAWESGNYSLPETLAGRRVVISTDGGRTRIRRNKVGRKTRKGRRRYSTRWREPKLLIVYVVDGDGKQDSSMSPIIDATMAGPDAIFGMFLHYLRKLEIEKAEQVLCVADGAHWIWRRFHPLVKALGLDPERVFQLIDFYHAVEHLGSVAALRKSWSNKQRKAWVLKHRQLLLNGEVGCVIAAVKELCRGRNSKAVRTQRNYFINNHARMAYAKLKDMKFPIGSGAVESAIRRVINLRLKGPGIFWCRENAEAMLMLRSYYKAGRWESLVDMATSHHSILPVA